MFKRMEKPQIILLTPEMAKRLLLQNNFDSQRKPRIFWINYLANKITQNRFTTGSIALAHHNGTVVMVNGQHQCQAVMQVGKKIYVTFEKYLCPEPSDVSELYREFDSHLPRSLGDVVQVEIDSLGLKWPKTLASRLASAGAMVLYGYPKGSNATKDVKVETIAYFLPANHEIIKLYAQSAKDFKHLNRGPVLTTMIASHNKCQRDWPGFWIPTRDGDNLRKNDPRKMLRDYLIEVLLVGGNTNGRHPVTYREMLCKSITAWNAYRKGTTTSLRYYPDKPMPRVL
jgi:hypothetical protein